MDPSGGPCYETTVMQIHMDLRSTSMALDKNKNQAQTSQARSNVWSKLAQLNT